MAGHLYEKIFQNDAHIKVLKISRTYLCELEAVSANFLEVHILRYYVV